MIRTIYNVIHCPGFINKINELEKSWYIFGFLTAYYLIKKEDLTCLLIFLKAGQKKTSCVLSQERARPATAIRSRQSVPKKEGCSRSLMYSAILQTRRRAHAERFYGLLKDLSGETVHIDGSYPIDQQDTLPELLRAAEHNEHEEYADVYQAFGDTAKEEGFLEAASAFYQIAEIEHVHEKRFGALADMLGSNMYIILNRYPGGCVRTAAIYMKVRLRRKYALCAGMSRDIFSHMQWPATNCHKQEIILDTGPELTRGSRPCCYEISRKIRPEISRKSTLRKNKN